MRRQRGSALRHIARSSMCLVRLTDAITAYLRRQAAEGGSHRTDVHTRERLDTEEHGILCKS